MFQLAQTANATAGYCNGLIEAWKLKGDPNAAILFVIPLKIQELKSFICDLVIDTLAEYFIDSNI